jgi:hypothetical protein
MSFYGEAELEGLEAQCWSTLGDWTRAARHARRAAELQDPHFTRNIALYTAELADDLARGGSPDEAAAAGMRVLDLLTRCSPRGCRPCWPARPGCCCRTGARAG